MSVAPQPEEGSAEQHASRQRARRPLRPWRHALLYVVVAGLWIIFSDSLVALVLRGGDPNLVQTIKGLLFVVVTALLLYLVLRRADFNIRRREERFRELFTNDPDPLLLLDGEGCVQDANPSAERFFGEAGSELTGRPLASLFEEGARAPLSDHLASVRVDGVETDPSLRGGREGPRTLTLRARLGRGEEAAHVELSTFASHENAGFQLVCRLRDVSEARQAREQLVLQAAIVEQSSDAIIVADLSGQILSINRGARVMQGFTEEEVVGRPVSVMVDTESGPLDPRIVTPRVLAEGSIQAEGRLRRKGGGTFPARIGLNALRDERGEPLAIVGYGIDLTREHEVLHARAEADRRLRLAIESARLGEWEWELGSGRVRWSDEARALFGLEERETSTAWVEEVVDPSAKAEVARRLGSYVEEADAKELLVLEVPVRRGEDPPRTVEMVGRLLVGTDWGPGRVIGVCQDVTERRRAERDLAQALAFTREVFETVQEGVVVLDNELRLEAINPFLEEMTGLTNEEVEGRPITEVFPFLVEIGFDALLERALGGESVSTKDAYFPTQPSGRSGWFAAYLAPRRDGEGRISGVLGTVSDITERKVAEIALAESEAKYRAYIQHSPIAVFIANATGRYVDVNPAACRMTGYSREELVGMPITELDISTEGGTVATALETTKRQGSLRAERVLRRKDGRSVPVDLAAVPLEGGHFMAFCADISERMSLERQLRTAQRMEAIGQLAGGIAHDFNNLLQVINGNAELSLLDVEPTHPSRDAIESIATAGEKAAILVRQLLAFGRQQLLQPRHVDPNETIATLLKLIGRTIGEHIRLSFRPASEAGFILVDPGQLEQVIMNLCVNARDAMAEGGELIIETDLIDFDEEYVAAHPEARPGEHVLISVSDTGHGMSPEVQARIFEPFFTTKAHGEGTGLGLAMAYGIVRQHEGTIQVYSETGVGTTIKLYFPRVEPRTSAAGKTIEARPTAGDETILVAEDDDSVRTLVRRVLETAGYRVLIAKDGAEAIELAEERLAEIDLALLDVVMPGISGAEAAERIVALRPELPVLFASGYSAHLARPRLGKSEVGMLQKPFSPRVLLERVRETLDAAKRRGAGPGAS